MNAFLLDCLYPTGWRRTGEIYWRYSDALDAGCRATSARHARAVRILGVRIVEDALLTLEAPPEDLGEWEKHLAETRRQSIARLRERAEAKGIHLTTADQLPENEAGGTDHE